MILGIIVVLLGFYITIQTAIDKSINTKLLKENLKVLVEIRDLLKDQNKNI